MPQKMSDVYKVSLKEIRFKLKTQLQRNEQAYSSLSNKESKYALAIKGMTDLHKAAYKIYMDAPDEI